MEMKHTLHTLPTAPVRRGADDADDVVALDLRERERARVREEPGRDRVPPRGPRRSGRATLAKNLVCTQLGHTSQEISALDFVVCFF